MRRDFLRPLGPIALTAIALAVLLALWPIAARRLAGRLATLAESETVRAEALSQTLRRLDDAGAPALLRLATDDDPSVAGPARRALAARVDAWRHAARLRRDGHARRLRDLLTRLAERRGLITEGGRRWAERFAMGMLQDASLAPPAERASLIAAIDRAVEAVLDAHTLPAPPAEIVAEQPAPAPGIELTPAAEPLPAPPRPFVEVAEALPPPPAGEAVPQAEPRDWTPEWDRPAEPRELVELPTKAEPLRSSTAASSAPPLDPRTANDRELFAALLEALADRPAALGPRSADNRPAALDPTTAAISEALSDRGYRGVSLQHVRALLSDEPRDRIALVERLLLDRGGDTAKLLLLLAHDDDAEVRVAALTAMAASPRRELVEASWEIALRDEDPRVGGLIDAIGQRLR